MSLNTTALACHYSRLAVWSTLLLAGVMAGGTASAQNEFALDRLGPGEILVNLNVSEQIEVDQDTLHASLQYSTQGRDRVVLQDEVNQVMAQVVSRLEAAGVDFVTERYSVYQIQVDRPVRGAADNTLWRAQQGVGLSGMDDAVLLDLVAELQGMDLTLNSLYYSLSSVRRQQVVDGLLEAALERLQERAAALAAALGKSDAEIIEISVNTDGGGDYFRGATMAMAMEARDIAAPVAEPGKTTVVQSIAARVVLLP